MNNYIIIFTINIVFISFLALSYSIVGTDNIYFLFNIFFGMNLILYIFFIRIGSLDIFRPDFVIFIFSFFAYYIGFIYTETYLDYFYSVESILTYMLYIVSYFSIFLIIFNLCLYFFLNRKVDKKFKKQNNFNFWISDKIVFYTIFLNILLNFPFIITGYKTIHTSTLAFSILDLIYFPARVLNLYSIILSFYYLILLNLKKIDYINNNRAKLIVYLIYFNIVLNLISALLSGSKGALFWSVIVPYIFVYYLIYGKFLIRYLFIGIFILIIILPVINIYREYVTFGGHYEISIFERLSLFYFILVNIYQNFNLINLLDSLQIIIGRISMAEQIIRVIDFINSGYYHLLYGKTIFPLIIYSFIPQFIWEDRPLTNIGRWFGHTFGYTTSDSDVFISLSIPGEAYLNFGFYGIVVSVVSAIILAKIYIIFKYKADNLFYTFFYYIIFTTLIMGYTETYIVAGVINVIKIIITFMIIFLLIKSFRGVKYYELI